MRRINKDDCRNAARKLSDTAFDKKIEEIDEEFKVIGDELVNAYIPKPLIALSIEYSDMFIDKKGIIPVRSEQERYYSDTIYVPSNVVNPLGERKVFFIDNKTYKELKSLVDKRRNLFNRKQKYIKDVSEALWSLRTKRKISESFPEALPYLDFDDGVKSNLPVPKYEELRSLLKNDEVVKENYKSSYLRQD